MAHPFSVRQALGGDVAWDIAISEADAKDANEGASKRTDRNPVQFVFMFPERLFQHVFYPRMRGVSVYLVPKEAGGPRGVFQARIRPPEVGRTRFFLEDARTHFPFPLDLMPVKVNGISIPPNITQRESLSGVDVVGVAAFSNLSPFGGGEADGIHQGKRMWILEVERFSTQGEDFAQIAFDLEVEVNIAHQAPWR
jgi:hypothetical protein